MANIEQAVKSNEAVADKQLTKEKIEEWVQSVQHDASVSRGKIGELASDKTQQQTGGKVPFIVEDDAGSGGKNGSNK